MKNYMKRALVFAGCLCTTQIFAATAIDGLYLSVFGGYTYLPNNVNTWHYDLHLNHVTYESGYNAGGSFGYKGNVMRYEGEIAYIRASVDHFAVNNTKEVNSSGYSDAVLATANVYYEMCELIPSFVPWIGGGLGYAWVESKLNNFHTDPVLSWNNSDILLAFRGMAGITYNFAESYALDFSYRYAVTDKGNFGRRFQAHMVNIGAVYRFDGANYI